MKIAVLDAATLGEDLSLSPLSALGDVTVYPTTAPAELPLRAAGADVLVLNKVRIHASVLPDPGSVKLICIAATGTDNIDLAYCRAHGIGVCNVRGYSTNAVCQVTVAMVLSLCTHLPDFTRYVNDGRYTRGGVANCLTPVYHELYGKTWGIVGYGNIGKAVGRVAAALGCRLLVHKRNAEEGVACVDMDTLCRESDVISVHLPLTDATRGIVSRERIAAMKPTAVLVNTARGAVLDETAVAQAVLAGKLGGFGCDVYSAEPFPESHPYTALLGRNDVCLTPHMAWGGQETRERCLAEICENIRSYRDGGNRSRVD